MIKHSFITRILLLSITLSIPLQSLQALAPAEKIQLPNNQATFQSYFNTFYERLSRLVKIPIQDVKLMWPYIQEHYVYGKIQTPLTDNAKRAFKRTGIPIGTLLAITAGLLIYKEWTKQRKIEKDKEQKIENDNKELFKAIQKNDQALCKKLVESNKYNYQTLELATELSIRKNNNCLTILSEKQTIPSDLNGKAIANAIKKGTLKLAQELLEEFPQSDHELAQYIILTFTPHTKFITNFFRDFLASKITFHDILRQLITDYDNTFNSQRQEDINAQAKAILFLIGKWNYLETALNYAINNNLKFALAMFLNVYKLPKETNLTKKIMDTFPASNSKNKEIWKALGKPLIDYLIRLNRIDAKPGRDMVRLEIVPHLYGRKITSQEWNAFFGK